MLSALLATAFISTAATAQVSIYGGGGVTIPVGAYAGTEDFQNDSGAKTGWMAQLGFGVPIGASAWGVDIGGFYGNNSHDEEFDAGSSTTLYGALGGLTYRLGDRAKTGVFLYGGLGFLTHKYSSDTSPDDGSSEANFAYQLGAGLDIPMGKVNLWLFTGYLGASGSATIPILAGISIPLGGGGN
jgi:opacity protein-like surface antigen